jgi:hypothetical protein
MHPDDIEQIMQLYACGDSYRVGSEDLAGAIERALGSKDFYRDARARYFGWVFGSRDRLAPERVAEALRSLQEEG